MLILLMIQAVVRFAAMAVFSGTIATAGTSQQAVPANSDRVYLACQSPAGNTGTLYFDFGRAANATTGTELVPGGSFTYERAIPMTNVTVTSPTAGATFRCREGTNQ